MVTSSSIHKTEPDLLSIIARGNSLIDDPLKSSGDVASDILPPRTAAMLTLLAKLLARQAAREVFAGVDLEKGFILGRAHLIIFLLSSLLVATIIFMR